MQDAQGKTARDDAGRTERQSPPNEQLPRRLETHAISFAATASSAAALGSAAPGAAGT